MSNDNDNHDPKTHAEGCGCGHDHGTENDPATVYADADNERPRFTKNTKRFVGKDHEIVVDTKGPGTPVSLTLTLNIPAASQEDVTNDTQRISPPSDEAGDRAVMIGKAVLDVMTLGSIHGIVDPCGLSMSIAGTLLDNAVRNDHANCAKAVAMEFLMKNMLSTAISNMGGMAVLLGKDGKPDFSRAMSLTDENLPEEVREAAQGVFGKPDEPTKH